MVSDIFTQQDMGHSIGPGRRCALILVDFVNGFVDPDMLGSPEIAEAAQATQALLTGFRDIALPIVHTRVVFAEDGSDHNIFCLKVPRLAELTETAHASQIVRALTPRQGEHVLRKTSASAFFATSLADWLRLRGVDTVAIAGCTTSGCVRATTVDAMQHNFRPLVIRDCVADRSQSAHRASLLDLQHKYADVLEAGDLLHHLSSESH